jgi:D-alanyl-D-alanine carboxypeptidase
MIQSSFVNPNGLPAEDQIVSARDMAILARALIREMPEYDYYWHLPGIRMGKMVQRNYNTLLGRYPGADGMKTGFICASGFNLVASATRDGRRLIAVVLGAPSAAVRALKAAQLLERGFNSRTGLSWLMPTLGTVESVQPVNVDPPNLREEMCGKNRKRPAAENEDDTIAADPGADWPQSVFLPNLQQPKVSNAALLLQDVKLGEPVLVYTGTKPPAPKAQAAAADTAKKKTATVKPPAPKDAIAATPSGEGAAVKPKPVAPKTKDAAVAKDGATSTAATGDGAAKPKPKKPAPPKDASKDGAGPGDAAAGDAAAPKPKPKKPKPAPTNLTPAVEKTSHVQ